MSESERRQADDVRSSGDRRIRGDIAIVGMAALFPGAPDLTSYWANILGKVDSVTDPPAEAWDPGVHFDVTSSERDRVYCQRGGYLASVAYFDPLENGVMPRSVEGGEPDQWLALAVARAALRDAGYLDRLDVRHRTAVVIGKGTYVNRGNLGMVQHGVMIQQTLDIVKSLHPDFTPGQLDAIRDELKACLPPFTTETVPGLIPNIIAGRIANRLDLMGPSYTIDAACASSLIALQVAMRDLLTDECDMALVGGAQITTPLPILSLFCQLNALSRRQQIRPFDKDADGTILGEGIGMVVLKRREDAERDGDRIYALLKGVGAASDGRAVSVMAPRIEGEELAVRRAYESAGVDPDTVQLIEAHGTGTLAGDAAELQALGRVFSAASAAVPHCAIGTVKSMIGHTMPAAGVAGVIKAALALYHRVLPPTLNVSEPNPHLDASRFYLNTETRPWINGSATPRRAGVNAFGFGGINAHAVLEEYPQQADEVITSHQLTWDSEAIVLQAASPADLVVQVEQLLRFLEGQPVVALKDLAYSINTGQPVQACRLSVVASSLEDLRRKLERAQPRLADPSCRQIKDKAGIYYFAQPLAQQGKLAVLFPGEGAQYTNMLADLCLHFPEVRAAFDQMDRVFHDHPRGYRCSDVAFPPTLLTDDRRAFLEERLWQIDGAVEAILTANQGMTTLMNHLGLKGDVIVGHSTGEYSAMRAGGILNLEDELVFARFARELNSGHQEAVVTDGVPGAGMLAVGADYEQVAAIVAAVSPENLYVAMDNCPHQAVIVGERSAVEQARAVVQQQGLASEFLAFDRAYHTPLFAPYAETLRQAFDHVTVSPPRVPTYSCTTAAPYPDDPAETRDLMIEHWVKPVEFRRTIETLYAEGVRVFVEVGPRGNLTAFTDDILRGRQFCAVSANVQHRTGISQLNHCVALLMAHGVDLTLDRLYEQRSPRAVAWTDATPPAAAPISAAVKLATGFPVLRLSAALTEELRHKPSTRIGNDVATPTAQPTPPPAIPAPLAHPTAPPVLEVSAALTLPVDATLAWSDDPTLASEVSGAPSYSAPLIAPEPVVAPALPNGADATLQDYLRTMDQFLTVQEQVMRAYLEGEAPSSPVEPQAPPVTRSERVQTPVEMRPSSAPTVAGLVQAAPAVMVQPVHPSPTAPRAVVISAPQTNQRERVTEQLLALISERTGYPTEMLGPHLDLEADLGIDSIKRVEILGTFRRLAEGIAPVELERLTSQRTIQGILDAVVPPTLAPQAESWRGPTGAQAPMDGMVEGQGVAAPPLYPLLGRVISWDPERELITRREFHPDQDLYLRDHSLGRNVSDADPELLALCVMPLTMSLEMMAEAASYLLPGRVVTALRHIRASRWIAFDGEPQEIQIVARAVPGSPDTVAVHVRNLTEDAQTNDPLKSPVLEATIVLSAAYPSAPATLPTRLTNKRPSRWTTDRLYTEGMFHGRRWQGVSFIDQTGDDGVRAGLLVLPFGDFFDSMVEPRFVLDPVVLDAAGQAIGFWTLEHLPTARMIFPFRVAAVEIYGDQCPEGDPITCLAKVELIGEQLVRSDVDMTDGAGRLWMRLVGWEDKRFELPEQFQRLLLTPRETEIATAWPAAVTHLAAQGRYECRSTIGAFASDTALWIRVWASCILSRAEREQFRAGEAGERPRLAWLAGRAAAKEAVRQLLRTEYGRECLPADIEIVPDAQGKPVVRGAWSGGLPGVPLVSISHSDNRAVAVAALPLLTPYLGVEINDMRNPMPSAADLAFTPAEQQIVDQMPSLERTEWTLRCWAAKKALAKALGRGLFGGSPSVVVEAINPRTGRIDARLTGELARFVPDLAQSHCVVGTVRLDTLIVATTIAQRVSDREPLTTH